MIDNMTQIHAKYAGYVQLLRFKGAPNIGSTALEVKGLNINYYGTDRATFVKGMYGAMFERYINTTNVPYQWFEAKFGTISNCLEKRLILIMLVARKLGLFELVSVIAEIFRLPEVVV